MMKRALRGSNKSSKWLKDKIAQAGGYKDHADAVEQLKQKNGEAQVTKKE